LAERCHAKLQVTEIITNKLSTTTSTIRLIKQQMPEPKITYYTYGQQNQQSVSARNVRIIEIYTDLALQRADRIFM
jgi:hypothetical protein